MSEEKEKNEERNWTEEIEVAGGDLVERVKELIEEGNVRRLIIRKPDGELLLEMPLTAGVVAGGAMAMFAMPLALIAVVAGFIARVKVEIVRVEEVDPSAPPEDEA